MAVLERKDVAKYTLRSLRDQSQEWVYLGYTHRLLSSSFLGLPYRIPNMNHKKELLGSLWVVAIGDSGSSISGASRAEYPMEELDTSSATASAHKKNFPLRVLYKGCAP